MGDEVIKEVSNYMQSKIYKEGVVGRFGGEEFLSILSQFTTIPKKDRTPQLLS